MDPADGTDRWGPPPRSTTRPRGTRSTSSLNQGADRGGRIALGTRQGVVLVGPNWDNPERSVRFSFLAGLSAEPAPAFEVSQSVCSIPCNDVVERCDLHGDVPDLAKDVTGAPGPTSAASLVDPARGTRLTFRRSAQPDIRYRCAVRLGVISDIHGVASALGAVLRDGERLGVERWWALGDLVLFGPHPVEVLEMLAELDDVALVAGNTDRYVLTDDQPEPHATPEAAMGDADLVRRYGLMAAGAAWTRGVLDQAGVLGTLDGIPTCQSTHLEDGTRLLGVHASPASDDGRGFDMTSTDSQIAGLLSGIDTDWVVGGHTHDPTDRDVAGIRVLNPGSVGLPRRLGSASWMVVDDVAEVAEVEHRSVGFDVATVVEALHRRRHPNREFIASHLTRGTFVEAN